MIFDKKGSSQKEIAGRIIKGRKLIQSLNSVLWDKKMKTTTKKKKTIYGSIVQSVLTYGAEVRDVCRK